MLSFMEKININKWKSEIKQTVRKKEYRGTIDSYMQPYL